MKPEIKKRWVDALRSGNYKQGREALHDITDDTFCCLGVLCDIVKDEISLPSNVLDDLIVYGGEEFDDVLPTEVVKYAELTQNDPSVRYEGSDGASLTALNDLAKLSFSQIADLIEERL